jgi:hypothetical protein
VKQQHALLCFLKSFLPPLLVLQKPLQGNIRFRQLVHAKMNDYETAKTVNKTLIAETVVQSIKDLNGKFVRQAADGGGWEEVDDETARDKVAHTFRDKRRKLQN